MHDLFTKLTDICQSLRPPLRPGFLPPALDSEILRAEAELGLSFPNDLKNLLLCANGQVVSENGWFHPVAEANPIFPMIRFAPGKLGKTSSTWLRSVEAIVDTMRWFRENYQPLEDDSHFETYGPAYYHDQMIWFTMTENSDSLVIDLQPKPGGHVGQVIMLRTQPCQIAVLAPSLSSFLQLVSDGYASGRFQLGADGFLRDWGDE